MPKKKPVPGYIWMLSGLIIGLFAAFIVYLDKQPADDINFAESIRQELKKARAQNQLTADSKPTEKPAKTTKSQSKPDTEHKKPQFEFYTILSELEVFIPDLEMDEEEKPKPKATNPTAKAAIKKPENTRIIVKTTSSPKNKTITIPKTKSRQKNYLLQAGSFKNKKDAERLKASLALLGVQSSIQSININQDNWHRVRIGPFSKTSNLRETINTLKQNNIHAMTMELK